MSDPRSPSLDAAVFVDEWGHELTDEEVDAYLAAKYPDWHTIGDEPDG